MSLVLAMDKIWFVTQTLAFSVKKFSSESNVQKFNAKSMGRKKKKETVPVVQWQKIIPLQQTMEIRTQFLFTITLHSFSRITITLHIYKMAKEKQEWTLPENDWRKQKKALQKSWRTETYQKSVMKVLHLSYTARSNLFLLLQEIPIWFT